MSSSIFPTTSTVMSGVVAWLAELIAKPRGVGLDITYCPKTNSTTNHPFYNADTGRWIMPKGTLLAKITSSGLYGMLRRTQANGAAGAGVDVVTVDDPQPMSVGETWTNGVLTFVISSINYTTKVVTATAVFGGAGIADNAELYENTVAPGLGGVANAVSILLEDADYTSSNDITVATVDNCKVNESAMPYTTIHATVKAFMPQVQWL